MLTLFKLQLPGLLLSGIVGFTAVQLSNQFKWLGNNGFGALTLAILIGIILGNLRVCNTLLKECSLGISFSKQRLLRLGIIFYGLKLTFQEIEAVGYLGIAIDIAVILSTFSLAIFLGMKYFKLDRDTVILIGVGSSICGVAAVLATESVVKASNEKVAVAVSTVVIFGTIAMFLYPLIYKISQAYFYGEHFASQFGIYIGSTVHEVAQVIVAARSISSNVADTAVIEKMVRVIMLGPFLITLSTFLIYLNSSKQLVGNEKELNKPLTLSDAFSSIPWFAFLFLIVIVINSLDFLPGKWVNIIIEIDYLLLAMAMAAVGISTRFSAVTSAGIKPLLLGFALFLWLIVGGGLINIGATALF